MTGALVVQRALRGIGDAALSTHRPLLDMNRTLGLIAAGGALYKIGQQLNTFQRINNGLRTVTSSAAELHQAMEEIYEVSQRSRSSFEDTAQVFVRVKRSVADMGVSSREALDITEKLNKALQIGGATGQERFSVLIQFSQALASGVLRGDELRSILENSTVLGDIFAKQMNTTRGQLRQLGKEGKITSEELIMAFRNYGFEINEAFEKTVPTIEQAFIGLRNQANKALLDFDNSFGVSRGLVWMLQQVGKHMDTIIKLAPTMAASFAAVNIGTRVIGTNMKSVLGHMLSMALVNPYVATAAGLAAAGLALYAFRDDMLVTQDNITTFGDFMRAIGPDVVAMVNTALNALGPLGESIRNMFDFENWNDLLWGKGKNMQTATMDLAREIDMVLNLFAGLANAIPVAFTNLPVLLERVFMDLADMMVNVVKAGFQKLVDMAVNLPGYIKDAILGGGKVDLTSIYGDGSGLAPTKGATADNIYDIITAEFNKAQGGTMVQDWTAQQWMESAKIGRDRDAHESELRRFASRVPNALGDSESKLKPGGSGAGAGGADKLANKLDQLMKSVDSVSRAQVQLKDAEETLNAAVAAGLIPLEKKNQILETLNYRLRDELDPIGEINRKLEEEIMFLGMSNSERDIQNKLMQYENTLREKGISLGPAEKANIEEKLRQMQELTRLGEFIDESFSTAFSQIGDALVEFVETGKLNFGDLVTSILRDIARLAMAKLIVDPLVDALGGFVKSFVGGMNFGSVATGAPMDIRPPGFATGGNLGPGAWGIAGEHGPELFYSGSRPVGFAPMNRFGGEGVGGTRIEVHNYGNDNARVESSREGNIDIHKIIIGKVKEGIASGDFDASMRNTFGVRRQV